MFAVQWTGVLVSISNSTHSLDASGARNATNRAIRSNGVPNLLGCGGEIVGGPIGKAIDGNRNLRGASLGMLASRRPMDGVGVLGERSRQFIFGAIIIPRSRDNVCQKVIESALQHASLVGH